MHVSLLKLSFPLLLAALVACSSSEIDLESIVGLYGCDPCLLGGSTLYLRQDGTYARCTFSDTPEFDGYFTKEEQGSYRLDGQQLVLQPTSSEKSSTIFVIRVRNRVYLVSEDEYEKYHRDYDVIEDVGLKRRPVTIDSPYSCEVDAGIKD